MKTGLIIGIIVVVVLLVGGIFVVMNGSYKPAASPSPNPNPTPPPSPTPGAAQTYRVGIMNFAFSPATLTIKAGDTVIWTNNDNAPHTVTSDSGSELASSTFNNGQTYSHTFNTAGNYDYHCSIHPSMKAKIIVQ